MRQKQRFAVVFDCDGTWTRKDSVLVERVYRDILPKKAQDEWDLLRGRYMARASAGTLSGRLQLRWLRQTFEVYVRCGLTLPQAYEAIDGVDIRPGVRDVCERLYRAGIPVAIISFGYRQFIRRMVARNGLSERHVAAICATDILTDPITRRMTGYDPASVVIPANKGMWSRRFARAHGVPLENLLAVGDSHGDAELGHFKRNRFGIAKDPQEAERIASSFGEVAFTDDYGPVLGWLREKTGLAL